MNKVTLNTTRDLNPLWFRTHFGKIVVSIIREDGMVEVDGELFYPEKGHFNCGDELILFFNGFFKCCLKSEYDSYLEDRERKLKQVAEKLVERSYEKRIEADLFNKQYESLPFKWAVAHMDNLSGLSESSWGDGRKRNTVEHILMLEDFDARPFGGRRKRKKGDYLCLASGKNWAGENQTPQEHFDASGILYKPQITCKQCLKIAEKWKN